jgi:hypothetical protein
MQMPFSVLILGELHSVCSFPEQFCNFTSVLCLNNGHMCLKIYMVSVNVECACLVMDLLYH